MDGAPYDPPLNGRRRSASFSASGGPPASDPRRRSTASLVPHAQIHSDTDSSTDGEKPLVDAPLPSSTPAPPYEAVVGDQRLGARRQSRDLDWMDDADLKNQRPGRMSKGREAPGTTHSNDAEVVLAQVYDLTHSIDALDNDIDEIHALRRKISKLDPKMDPGQISIHADLSALSALTTQTGKSIVSLEQWLTALHKNSKKMRADMKSGKATFKPQEIGELKFQVASAKLDFADAMERIREGAWQEQERRTRVRLWMARHIRARENDIPDLEVKKLLRASELGAAEGVINNDVTSYAGLWALNNPYTELAELTDGMRFLHDDLDTEIVNEIVPRPGKKTKTPKVREELPTPAPRKIWGASRLGFYSENVRQHNAREKQLARLNNEVDGAERDIEYGYARQYAMQRSLQRKKLVIALLVVLIIGLILLVWFATMGVPKNAFTNHEVSADQTIYFSINPGPVDTNLPTLGMPTGNAPATSASVQSLGTSSALSTSGHTASTTAMASTGGPSTSTTTALPFANDPGSPLLATPPALAGRALPKAMAMWA